MITNIQVKFKKLNEEAHVPSYGTPFAAGSDLYSITEDTVLAPGETAFFHTGLAFEIPNGVVGLVYARSGYACKHGIAPANKVGVIDSDYRGEIMVALHNHSSESFTVAKGDRIAQICFAPYFTAEFEEADTLAESERGEGGFGSTGRN